MNPLQTLIAGGHGQQPTIKKQPAPAPMVPGTDHRLMALMALLGKPQEAPQPQPNPAKKTAAIKKKPVPQRPTDSNAEL